MASIDYVVQRLAAAGLTVDVDGDFILCEDPDLDFERSHDGVKGVANWLRGTLDEYEAAMKELLEDGRDEERAIEFAETRAAIEEEQQAEELEAYYLSEEPVIPKEETVFNYVEWILKMLGRNAQPAADPPAREFAPAPPEKEHIIDSAQLALAKRLNTMSPKELWQAEQNSNQDRGGVPHPEDYIRDLKLEAPAVTVLVVGQTFKAPEGWKIKESRPSGKVLYYASILQDHKAENQARGAQFALVRQ